LTKRCFILIIILISELLVNNGGHMTKDRTVATLNSLLMRVGTFPEHPSYPGPLDIHVPEKLKNRGKAIEGANKLRKKMRWFWTPWVDFCIHPDLEGGNRNDMNRFCILQA
jgi:hypothetical protein